MIDAAVKLYDKSTNFSEEISVWFVINYHWQLPLPITIDNH